MKRGSPRVARDASFTRATRSAKNAGFTLVELSIVLVIIGLIIGGVLTGQQVLQNARINNAVNAVQGYQSAFATYSQNFGAVPGDDNAAATRFPGTPAVTNGSGGGTIAGAYDATTGTGDSRLFWSHLRAAGLIRGARDQLNQPVNPFNGIYGVQFGAFGTVFANTHVICLNNVPTAAAQVIDNRLDDGASNTGTFRAATTVGGTPVTAYDPTANATLIVCTPI